MRLFRLILLMSFLSGCESKKEIVRVKIPSHLLHPPEVDASREIKTNKDATIFMLDVFKAYEKCTLNLKAIKRINDE